MLLNGSEKAYSPREKVVDMISQKARVEVDGTENWTDDGRSARVYSDPSFSIHEIFNISSAA